MSLKTVLLIIVCVLIGVAIVLFLGYMGIEPFTQAYTYVSGWLTQGNILETLQNPTTITATIASASAVALPLISKINSYKDQALTVASEAKTQIDALQDEKDQILSTVNTYKAQAEAATKQLTDLQANPPVTDTTELNKQITSLESQLQATQDQSTNFIKGLVQAANGALVSAPDGKIYSVLKVSETIVK